MLDSLKNKLGTLPMSESKSSNGCLEWFIILGVIGIVGQAAQCGYYSLTVGWADCEEESRIAVKKGYGAGTESPNFNILEVCNGMINDLLEFDPRIDDMEVSFMWEVSKEVAEDGYYTSRSGPNRGKKWYP